MFNSLMSPSSSPCPSPVKEIAASIKRVSSPRRHKYKAFVGAQDPIISKSRMTMNGGFTDFRQCCYLEKEDSIESTDGGSSASSYRSDSCDSSDAIIAPHTNRHGHRFVKIPKKAFVSAVGHLSPRLSKKLGKAMEREKTPEAPKHPMWPTVMTTYGRGVSTSPVQTIMMPLEPSLTAMKAQAILDERRDIRIALQMLSYKASLQRQLEANNKHSPNDKGEDSPDESSSEEEEEEENEEREYDENHPEPVKKSLTNHIQVDVPNPESFAINPEINIHTADGRVETPDSSGDDGFQDESLFDALDLASLPTLTPEDLVSTPVAEVRNVHLVCDYIVLETGPPTESVFV